MSEHLIVREDNCKGCRRCEVACIAAHHGLTMKEAMKKRDQYLSRVQVIKTDTFKTTVRCHQCENAPCCQICPTGAIRQLENGEIVTNRGLCMACGMCMHACPYGCIQIEDGEVELMASPRAGGDQCPVAFTPAAVVEGGLCVIHPAHKVPVRCDLCKEWRALTGKEYTACMEACVANAVVLQREDGSILECPKPTKKPKAE